jgi:hypothetical protein
MAMMAPSIREHPADPARAPEGPTASGPPTTAVPVLAEHPPPAQVDQPGTSVLSPKEVRARVLLRALLTDARNALGRRSGAPPRTAHAAAHVRIGGPVAQAAHVPQGPGAQAIGRHAMGAGDHAGKEVRIDPVNGHPGVVLAVGQVRVGGTAHVRHAMLTVLPTSVANVGHAATTVDPTAVPAAAPSPISNARNGKVRRAASVVWAREATRHPMDSCG